MLRQPSDSTQHELTLPGPRGEVALSKARMAAESEGVVPGAVDRGGRLRIIHVINSVDPNVGGPATVVSRLAAAQAALGHDVTIFSSLDPGRRAAFDQAVSAIPGIGLVKVELADRKVSPLQLLTPGVWRQLKRAIGSADVVHLHGVWDVILLAAARVARQHGIPYVLRPCGMLDPWCLANHGTKKKLALRLVYRRLLERAACLHVLNPFESGSINPLKLSAPRKIIPNGIFFEEVDRRGQGDGKEFFRRFPHLEGKRYILFLSRMHYKKGLDLLAGAFTRIAAAVPEVDLVVVGSDCGAKAAFLAKIGRAGLKDRVHMLGALYGAEKFSACQHAMCFCLPSRQEGFSLAVTEALACGVPVAISRDTHFSEAAFVGAGLEFDLNVEQIAQALATILLASPGARRAMGEAGRQLIKSSFTWPKIAGMTVGLYRNILQGQRPSMAIGWRDARKVLVPALRVAAIGVAAWVIMGCKSFM